MREKLQVSIKEVGFGVRLITRMSDYTDEERRINRKDKCRMKGRRHVVLSEGCGFAPSPEEVLIERESEEE